MATLVLDSTTKTIQAVMSGAATTNNPEFTAAWADSTSSSLTEGATDGALNGTSAVTLVASPGSSTQRVIKWITIQNKDTASVTVTITYNNSSGSTTRQIAKVTLAPNDTWTLDGTFSSSGGLKSGGVTGPSSATDNAIARFDGTTGSVIQSSSASIDDNGAGTFVGTVNVSGTSSGPADLRLYEDTDNGTNYVSLLAPSSLAANRALGLPDPSATGFTAASIDQTLGYINAPINSQSAAYTTVAGDAGKVIFHPSTDANARTFTIDSNANVAYPTGTVLTFINMTSQVVTIAITSDTMYLAGTGTTGSRSLAQYGMATAVKMTSTTWLISGSGLT
jgi:hypothetical protein